MLVNSKQCFIFVGVKTSKNIEIMATKLERMYNNQKECCKAI